MSISSDIPWEPPPTEGAKIRQRAVSGRWRKVKSAVLVAAFALIYILPWVPWQRGADEPTQAVLFSFTMARAYVFGFTFWPQDLYLLVLVLLAAAFGLFFTNTLVGRVWCGFTCPQTLWTDLFQIIERRVEGRHPTALRSAIKQVLWVTIAVVTGLTFISYVVPTRELWPGFFTGTAPAAAILLVAVFAVFTYLLAGYAREKVCLYMCPWPRFQAAMLDADSQLVTYQAWRGEPRGKHRKRSDVPLGDCVDCNLCVAVCPTGVDIRDGMQLGCIGCGLCIDACNNVMAKTGSPANLIGFFSEREMAAKAPTVSAAAPVVAPKRRPRVRMIGFASLFAIALVGIVVTLTGRSTMQIAVTPERQPPYVVMSNGDIRNVYQMRISNLRADADRIRLAAVGEPDASIAITKAGGPALTGDEAIVPLPRGSSEALRVLIALPPEAAPDGREAMTIALTDAESGAVLAETATYFWGPDQP